MRYFVAVSAAVLVLFALSMMTGFADLPRPWGNIARGASAGAVVLVVLVIWERLAPQGEKKRQGEQNAQRDQERLDQERLDQKPRDQKPRDQEPLGLER